MMDRVAAGLQRDGVPVGGTIAIAAYTSLEYAAVFLGALRAGVGVAPLQPGAMPDSLAGMIADSGAALLFLDAPMGAALASATRPIGATRISLDGSAAGRPLADWLPASG